MCEVLVSVNPNKYTHEDINKDRRGVYKKGYIVNVREDNMLWGPEEELPNFIVVKMPGVKENLITPYLEPWQMKVGFKNEEIKEVEEKSRLTVYSIKVNPSGVGELTSAIATPILNKEGALNIISTKNAVAIDLPYNFKYEDTKEKIKKDLEKNIVYRRQYYLSEKIVDSAIENKGEVKLTLEDFEKEIKDRLDE